MAVSGMTATFRTEHKETLVAKINYSTAKEWQNTEEPSSSLVEESTTEIIFVSVEEKKSRPNSVFPRAPVLVGRSRSLQIPLALNPLDLSRNEVDLQIPCHSNVCRVP